MDRLKIAMGCFELSSYPNGGDPLDYGLELCREIRRFRTRLKAVEEELVKRTDQRDKCGNIAAQEVVKRDKAESKLSALTEELELISERGINDAIRANDAEKKRDAVQKSLDEQAALLNQIREAARVELCDRCNGGRLWADGKAHYATHQGATIACPSCDGEGNAYDIEALQAALSLTAPQALARVQAEVIRELRASLPCTCAKASDENCQWCQIGKEFSARASSLLTASQVKEKK